MATKIEKKITGYRLVTDEPVKEEPVKLEKIEEVPTKRPDVLQGSTYKIKPPVEDGSAIYITINDVIVNEGTENEHKRPFEIFLNSKNMDSFQWISAITRLISSVFRKGGDITFLVEELRNVHQPNGGYYQKGKFYTSIVAEIAEVLEKHMISIGMIKPPELDEHQKALVESKKQEYLEKHKDDTLNSSGYPKGATLCSSCNETAVIMIEGCQTCLNCAQSKCG